jgi:2-dehydro-3-deoxyphosphogluconate aldolase/(4S)-4-hydroxy-2-oxoglutarate aldolase
MCRRYDVPCILGAFTSTEILNPWETGANAVKVFPITALGPSHIKDILGPFPQIKLAPTGGINLANLGEFLKARAVFVGVGSALVGKAMVAAKKWDELSIQASRFAEP